MRNPLRTEAEAFRFLLVVIAGAAVIVVCSYINEWVGVAGAVLVLGGIGWWLASAPPAVGPGPPEPLAPASPPGPYRILLLAAPGAEATVLRDHVRSRTHEGAAEVLVVVPALAAPVEAVTGDVDGRREDAQHAADAFVAALRADGIAAQGVVGADEPLLAVEDSLREFGADEVVLAGGTELLAAARERIAVPVSLLD